MKRIAILGATGGVGHHLVQQALARGDQVLVIARDPSRLDPAWGVDVVPMDLQSADHDDLSSCFHGVDAVVSALGTRSVGDRGILSAAARSVTAAMTASGVRRYIGISAAPVATTPSPGRPSPPTHDPGDDAMTRYVMMPIVKRVFAGTYADAALMEDIVRAGDIDWTIVRPPRLTNGPVTGRFRIAVDANVRGGRSISRGDLASAMLALLEDDGAVGHAVGVAHVCPITRRGVDSRPNAVGTTGCSGSRHVRRESRSRD